MVDGSSSIDVAGRGAPGAWRSGNSSNTGDVPPGVYDQTGSYVADGGSHGGYGGLTAFRRRRFAAGACLSRRRSRPLGCSRWNRAIRPSGESPPFVAGS